MCGTAAPTARCGAAMPTRAAAGAASPCGPGAQLRRPCCRAALCTGEGSPAAAPRKLLCALLKASRRHLLRLAAVPALLTAPHSPAAPPSQPHGASLPCSFCSQREDPSTSRHGRFSGMLPGGMKKAPTTIMLRCLPPHAIPPACGWCKNSCWRCLLVLPAGAACWSCLLALPVLRRVPATHAQILSLTLPAAACPASALPLLQRDGPLRQPPLQRPEHACGSLPAAAIKGALHPAAAVCRCQGIPRWRQPAWHPPGRRLWRRRQQRAARRQQARRQQAWRWQQARRRQRARRR